ncbi:MULTISPECIES: PDZ domain-containing protein [unclassified Shewanella]|uniref:M61 family metallopeptidase n=1 Tax=unclassified Shewanella TaxID=196818 RepID=UPI000C82B1BF|nr:MULTISPECIES: PDZ domain-containing protein [unclassified Shewanella]MDO6774676.1 PDZ domain-containing protein [Shewanella sp. 3_MG-2023]PMG49854.1 peptidase M61 [Shewanella sp. 10N.286.52.B9]
MKAKKLTILSASLLFSASSLAQVSYQIDLTQPQHHLAQVNVSFPTSSAENLTVNLPVWRTGKYAVLPLADGVRSFTATDEQGQVLPWQRTETGEWQVNLSKPTAVNVSYQLYANDLGTRVRHIDSSHAYIDASGVFMYSPEFRDDNVLVSMNVPQGWNSYSGMAQGSKAHSFIADNYDVLIDSPIETGENAHYRFTADGREYELVFWGEGNYDAQQIVTDLTKISSQAEVIWDDYPFERYVYMVHATSGARGATEHLNSTIIQLPRFNFRERKDYLRFISTASHEFIHTWNVKAYRPQGLVPYDYQNASMTELLWMAEGSTSYFQNQLLLRADVITPKEFFADLAKRINNNLHKPGREIQSVAQASLNEWTNTGGDYAINHGVNIYSEGYLASLSLDFNLLKDTQLAHSYRDVHRQLYRDHKLPKGYSVDDVKGILKTLAGKDYQPWWQQHITQPFSLDFDTLLAQAGLAISYGKEPKSTVYSGMTLSGQHDDLTLSHVSRNSPAWLAGIVAGDEVVAINGLKVTAAGFKKRLEDFSPQDTINVSLFNNDTLKQLELTLDEQPKGELAIIGVDSPTAAQKAFLKAWLGIDWPFDEQGEFAK